MGYGKKSGNKGHQRKTGHDKNSGANKGGKKGKMYPPKGTANG